LDRKAILDRAGSPEDRILLAKILDKIEAVKKFHDPVVTEFFDPTQQNLVFPVLSKSPEISFIWIGGHGLAERQRAVICPDYMEVTEIDSEVAVLSITGSQKFQTLSHRDFLGAVLGLGIKREKVGDVIVTPQGCQLVVDRSVADFITRNLAKVSRCGVKAEKIPAQDIQFPDETVKEIVATVPSLRLDAVAAAGFGVSRSKMAGQITAERVRVNWLAVTDCSYPIKEGDKISIRGRGRVAVKNIRGETKKGRILLVLKRYL